MRQYETFLWQHLCGFGGWQEQKTSGTFNHVCRNSKTGGTRGYVTVQTTGEGIISGCLPGIRSKDQVQEKWGTQTNTDY